MKLFMFGVIFRPFGVFVCVLLRPQFLKGEMPRHARGFASWNSLPKLFVMCGVFGSPSLQTHRAQPEHNGLLDAHQLDGDLQLLSQRLSEGFTHLTRKSTARRFPTQNQHMREALDRHCACDVCVCVCGRMEGPPVFCFGGMPSMGCSRSKTWSNAPTKSLRAFGRFPATAGIWSMPIPKDPVTTMSLVTSGSTKNHRLNEGPWFLSTRGNCLGSTGP